MRSALYYPHTTIQNERILKRALLLWDSVEFIVPWEGFRPHYGRKQLAEAAEIVAKPHVPSTDEKKQAHEQIQGLVGGTLPAPFYFRSREQAEYEIYPQKLLPDTWRLLREKHLASERLSAAADAVVAHPTGLSVMSILADCCAGKTRARITDRGAAYAAIANLLRGAADQKRSADANAREQFVSITLNVIDAGKIDLARLIAFRKRETKSGGHSYRDLRHRYLERMETYVKTMTTSKGSKADGKTLARELMEDMKDDVAVLGDELGFAKNEVLFSRDMIVAAMAGLGTIATAVFGAPMLVSGVVTAIGSPVTVGGLLASRNKFRSTRRSVLQKHPMAYLYELQHVGKPEW
jgi:hypothetical protein